MSNDLLRSNLLQNIYSASNQHPSLETAFSEVESLILSAFNAKRLSLFQRRTRHRDLVARYKTGDRPREIRVALNTHSIAGYVAMSQHPLIFNTPYDKESLEVIHSKLKFERKYDRLSDFKTKNVICVPIKCNGILLGVMEIINKEHGDFNDEDLDLALAVGIILGDAYRYELGGTPQPFEHLVHEGLLEAKISNDLSNNSDIKYAFSRLAPH